MLALNSAVAYQLQQFKKDVEALQAEGKSKEVAIFKVLKAYIKESKPIRFDGNGYSDEWKEEAAGVDRDVHVYRRTYPERIGSA